MSDETVQMCLDIVTKQAESKRREQSGDYLPKIAPFTAEPALDPAACKWKPGMPTGGMLEKAGLPSYRQPEPYKRDER